MDAVAREAQGYPAEVPRLTPWPARHILADQLPRNSNEKGPHMTTEERLEKLENELSRVKRRNRWLLMGAGLCLGIGLAAWAFGPGAALAQPAVAVPKEVRANSFVLEDANGKNRAALVVSKSGVAVLCLIDENGKARAALSGDVNGPGLRLFDEKGMCRSMLYVDMEGAWLDLRDEKGAPRATLYSDAKGPALILSEEGAPRAALYSVKEGGAPTLGENPADTALRSKLFREITQVAFKDIDFKDMITFLKNYSDANIDVNWTALAAAGIKQSTKVTVDERNISVKRVLGNVLDYVSRATGGKDVATYIIEDGILKVSTKSDLARKPRPTVAMHLYDEKGKRIWSAPNDEKGKPIWSAP